MTKETKKTKSKPKSKVKKLRGSALVEEIASEFFSLLGTKSRPVVSEDKENEAILVNIQTEDEAGLLIGNRGDTLDSIQSVLGMIYRQRSGEWKRVLVNVADWREKQEDRFSRLAIQAAERAKASGEAQTLYNLSPSQRRMVHLALVGDKEVVTESQGEGKERYLIVRPKKLFWRK
jgi:spoIIIJ-associated protein